MCNRNPESECILVKLCALFLNLSVKEVPNFMRKFYLIAELLVFKHRRQNISVPILRCLLQSLVRKWRCVVRIRSTFSRSVMVRYGCCKQSGAYRLVLHWSRYKGERPVLLRCFASSTASASHSRPVWRLLYFSTGQRSCPQGAWDRAAVNLSETPDFIAPVLWPANSPDLNPVDYQTWGKHRSRMHDVDQMKACLIEEWEHFNQVFIDEAIDQAVAYTSSSLHSSTQRTFWTQTLVIFDWYLYRRTLWQSANSPDLNPVDRLCGCL